MSHFFKKKNRKFLALSGFKNLYFLYLNCIEHIGIVTKDVNRGYISSFKVTRGHCIADVCEIKNKVLWGFFEVTFVAISSIHSWSFKVINNSPSIFTPFRIWCGWWFWPSRIKSFDFCIYLSRNFLKLKLLIRAKNFECAFSSCLNISRVWSVVWFFKPTQFDHVPENFWYRIRIF